MIHALLLVSRHPDDLAFAKAVASEAKTTLITAGDAPEALTMLPAKGETVILADVSHPERLAEFKHAFGSRIGDKAGQIDPNQIHLIVDSRLEELNLSGDATLFSHIAIRSAGNPEESGRHYGRILNNVTTQGELGLATLFSTKGTIKIIKITCSTEKAKVFSMVEDYLNSLDAFSSRAQTVVVTAVDELLLNAIYDAPSDARGEKKAVLEVTPGGPKEKHLVELQIGSDDEYVAFTVIDRFGSLDKSRLLNRTLQGYRAQAYQVDLSVARAGLGLATTFRMGGSLIFLSKPGVKTEVTVFFKRTRSFTEFREQFRFISIHAIPTTSQSAGNSI